MFTCTFDSDAYLLPAKCFIIQRRGAAAQRRLSLGILKNMRVSVSQRLGRSALFSQPVQADCRPPVPELLLPPEDKVHTSEMDLTSVFLPEFPQHVFPEPDHFKVFLTTTQRQICAKKIRITNNSVLSDSGPCSQRLIWTHFKSEGHVQRQGLRC